MDWKETFHQHLPCSLPCDNSKVDQSVLNPSGHADDEMRGQTVFKPCHFGAGEEVWWNGTPEHDKQ
jgi:hypothetical protein